MLVIDANTANTFNTTTPATDRTPGGATLKSAKYALALSDAANAEWAKSEIDMLSQKEVSALISGYLAAGTTPVAKAVTAQATAKAAPAGAAKGEWHCFEGSFYKVAQSQSTGKLYAKKRETDGFSFAGGIIWKLNATTIVTAEHTDAIKAWAEHTDTCVFCALPLDTPESTTAGYGPKCAKNQGLPWG